MFTGIIEQRGTVENVSVDDGSLRVSAAALEGINFGASVSVNGVCLTVVEMSGDTVRFDVVPETLRRTNLGDLSPGDAVNLELAMAADGRFDGHVVQGHVDGTGTVIGLANGDGGVVLSVEAPVDLMDQVSEKGSISIDGVSLTVASVTDSTFDVALIPHTLGVTTLGSLAPGDTVNLETDVIAKYVKRILRAVR